MEWGSVYASAPLFGGNGAICAGDGATGRLPGKGRTCAGAEHPVAQGKAALAGDADDADGSGGDAGGNGGDDVHEVSSFGESVRP